MNGISKRILSVAMVIAMVLTAVPLLGFAGIDLSSVINIFGMKAEATEYKVGDIIEFGSYPQIEVTDELTLSALNSIITESVWISYDYYVGNSGTYGSMKPNNFMKYADIVYKNHKYRAVIFSNYRPACTRNSFPSENSNTNQKNNGYYINTIYWFRYEPIKWRILDFNKGLILSEYSLDAQAYSNYTEYSSSKSLYCNEEGKIISDYETSSVRKWLNDVFYSTAFNFNEKNIILNSTNTNTSACGPSSNDTVDNVFLMSYYDSHYFNSSTAAISTPTDYSKSQGLNTNSNFWLLRSPVYYNGCSASCVTGSGEFNKNRYAEVTDYGIRPALRINLAALGNLDFPDIDDKTSNGTYYGTLESTSTVVVLNGTDVYYKINVDGTEYSLLPGMDNPNKYIDKKVVFTVEDNRITWIQSVDEIKSGLSCKVYSTPIDQKGNSYNTDKIQLTFKISNTLRDFKGNFDVLSEIPELNLNVNTIYVGTNDAEALNFGKDGLLGDEITTLTFDINKNISIGKTENITIDLPFKTNELDSNEKSKNVYLNYTVDLTQNSTPKQLRDNVKVVINNLNYSGTVVPPSDDSDISAEASAAADALENLTTAVSIGAHPSLNAITNNEQKTAMAQSLLTVVAVAQTPKAVLEKYLTEKVINKILKINVNTLTVRTGEVSCTYVVDNETYGEIKIKLTCEYNAYDFMESNFSGNGKISYEIVGGRGAKKLPENIQKSGYCGDLYFANVRAFFEKASSVVENALKNAYDKVYGDNLNKAADIIFGKVVSHIMKRTDYKSVSGLTWKLITTPIKEINVKCPVDVYIYNTEHMLVAAVENNEVILQGDENAEISVDGDVKNIILYDNSYTIEYFSTAESEMEIVVSEYGNSEQLLRTATISNIPLKIGLNYSQNVDDQILEDSDYSLTSNNGEIYSPESDIIDLHEHVSNGQWFIESEPSCTQNGKNYSICTNCNKPFYGETSPATGHDYVVSAWTWNGFKSAETKFVCVNDKSHFEIIKAEITSETTNPTCTSDGETVYMACVNFNGKTYTDTKVDVLTANGHSFGEWLITENATIHAEGKMERICSECNSKEEKSYSKDAVDLSIRIPTQTVIKYGDSIILHADTVLPAGAKVIWKADNDNFKYYVSSDGKECTITPDKNGDTTFTAYVVDENGEVISEEYTQTMTSKAGFFQKIIAFFKKLFGLTKTYPEVYKLIK